MQSRARFLSHPIHQILIVFPLGLLTTSVVFDIIGIVTHSTTWTYMATYMIGAGLIGGVAAAVFGLIDYLAIPMNTRARRVGRVHGLASAIVLVLFGIGEIVRVGNPGIVSVLAISMSLAGAVFAAVGGWLGGELVTRMGIGVDDDAALDAAMSFSVPPGRRRPEHGKPAAEPSGSSDHVPISGTSRAG